VTTTRLLADIGGTNARFARCTASGKIIDHRHWLVSDHADFAAALDAYISGIGDADGICAAAIAAAGPLDHGAIQLTNAAWRIDETEVSARLRGAPTRLMNDLEAVAMALPHLKNDDLIWLSECRAVPAAQSRMIAINIGTGFGAASITSSKNTWITSPSEPGHMSLGAHNDSELGILRTLNGQPPAVEAVLSGPGVASLYATLADRRKPSDTSARTAADVFAVHGEDAIAQETLHYVTVFLGRLAGDLALANGAWGGVYLCGSVAIQWAKVADLCLFRQHFEDKGKMSGRMRETPAALITVDQPAFIGLAHVEM
jgi:glucokinase